VLDTQLVLRASINRKSLPAKLLFDLNSAYQLVISDAILLEVRDVLSRPKLRDRFSQLTDEVMEAALGVLAAGEMVNPEEVPPISRDPKDDIFLACAKAAEADYLVTEDKDLLVLDPYDGIRIINALDFLRVLQSPQE
jgi:putative PIN family toxin of toxin-antitoxin system